MKDIELDYHKLNYLPLWQWSVDYKGSRHFGGFCIGKNRAGRKAYRHAQTILNFMQWVK